MVDYSEVIKALAVPTGVARKAAEFMMTFTDTKGHKQARIVNPGTEDGINFTIKTIRWAMHNGVRITIDPHN